MERAPILALRGRVRRFRSREFEGELGFPSRFAFGPDSATMLNDDLFADREAQAGATGAGSGFAALNEFVEDRFELGGGDSDSVIDDSTYHMFGRLLDDDLHLGAGIRKFDRV